MVFSPEPPHLPGNLQKPGPHLGLAEKPKLLLRNTSDRSMGSKVNDFRSDEGKQQKHVIRLWCKPSEPAFWNPFSQANWKKAKERHLSIHLHAHQDRLRRDTWPSKPKEKATVARSARSSSREVTIRVPDFFCNLL